MLKTFLLSYLLTVALQASPDSPPDIPHLPTPRVYAAATAFGSRVFLFGGHSAYRFVKNKGDLPATVAAPESFDTLTGSWKGYALMPTPRSWCEAFAIKDSIYVMGGLDELYLPMSRIEAFDPAANTWRSRAEMPHWMGDCVPVLCKERLYALSNGGRAETYATFGRYDVGTDQWIRLPDMPRSRSGFAAVEAGGKIYVIGGREKGYARMVDVFDPAKDAWETHAHMPFGADLETRRDVRVADGVIYVVDASLEGFFNDRVSRPTLAYDIKNDKWSARAGLPVRREGHELCVSGGRLYALGGYDKAGHPMDKTEVYDPPSDAWLEKAVMPFPRANFRAVDLQGRIFVLGGESAEEARIVDSTHYRDLMTALNVYVPETDHWQTALPRSGPTFRFEDDPASGLRNYAVIRRQDGVALIAEKQYGRAIEALKASTAANPDDPRAWQALGDAWYYFKNKPEALAAYGMALALEPGNATLKAFRARYEKAP